ncbi:MAG: type IX secretion system protein PorQ [Bacteroidia bacterium]
MEILYFVGGNQSNMQGIRILLLFMYCSVTGFAQVGGAGIYEFLNLSNSARSTSMAGAPISVRDQDLNLAIVNPALLDSTMSNQLALNYTKYLPDVNINYGFVSYAKHFCNIGTFNGTIQYVNYGQFKETDATGLQIGTFTASDYSYNLGYGKVIGKPDSNRLISVGANLKFIYSNLFTYSSTGVSADIACNYYNAKHNFSASVILRNYGRQLTDYYSGNQEPLPSELMAGIAFKPKHAPFRISLTGTHLQTWDLTYIDPANPPLTTDPLTGMPIKQNHYKIFGDKLMRHLLFGGELLLSKNFNIRFGYDYERRQEMMVDSRRGMVGWAFGFGFRIYKFHLSYGHSVYSIAGGSNTFSITTNLNDFYSRK